MDRENVIKGLNQIGDVIARQIGFEQARNFLRTIDGTVALLKEQTDEIKELRSMVEFWKEKALHT